MGKKLSIAGFATAVCMICASSARAAEASEPNQFGLLLAQGIIETVIYSAIGIIVLMIGYKVFDWVTPFSLNKEIAEDNNTAAGVAVAGIMVALGLIVAAALA